MSACVRVCVPFKGNQGQMRRTSGLMNCDRSCHPRPHLLLPSPLVPGSPLTPPPPPRDFTNCAQTDRSADQWCLAAAKHRTQISSLLCSPSRLTPLLPSVTAVAHLQMGVILSSGVGVSFFFFFSLLPLSSSPLTFFFCALFLFFSHMCSRTSPA